MPSDYREIQQPRTLLEALSQYRTEDLHRLVRNFWTGKRPTRKDEMISALLQVASEQNLGQLWPALCPLYKAAIAESVWSREGALNRDRFEAKYGRLPWTNEATDEEESRRFDPSDIQRPKNNETSFLDLIMPRDVLPRDVQLMLKGFVPKPEKAKVKIAESPVESIDIPDFRWNPETERYDRSMKPVPVVWVETERKAARELLAVLRLADTGQLSVTEKSRWPTPASVRAATLALEGGDYFPSNPDAPPEQEHDRSSEVNPGPIRAFTWPMLLDAGGLVHSRKDRLGLTVEGRAASTAPPHETLRELWRSFVQHLPLDELRRIDAIKGQTGKARRSLTDPTERRGAIAAALAECPVGEWVALDDFSTHMRAAGHHFEVSTDAWPLYIGTPRYGSLGHGGYHGWNILQLRYLLCVLMEYVATLGLIDIGYIPPDSARHDYDRMSGTDDMTWFSRYDGLMYLRLNALGTYCLELTQIYDAPPPEIRQAFAVLPDLQVVATAALSPADRTMLNALTTAVRTDFWQLDPNRTLEALAAGRTVAEITQFLESGSGAALPDAAAELLTEAQDRLTAFADQGAARLIRCRNGALAALLSQDASTHKTCYRLSEDVVVVPAKSEAAFLRGLRKLGYVLPERSSQA